MDERFRCGVGDHGTFYSASQSCSTATDMSRSIPRPWHLQSGCRPVSRVVKQAVVVIGYKASPDPAGCIANHAVADLRATLRAIAPIVILVRPRKSYTIRRVARREGISAGPRWGAPRPIEHKKDSALCGRQVYWVHLDLSEPGRLITGNPDWWCPGSFSTWFICTYSYENFSPRPRRLGALFRT